MSKNGSLISRISAEDLQEIVLTPTLENRAERYIAKHKAETTALAKTDDNNAIVAYLDPKATITKLLKTGTDKALATRAMFEAMSLDTALLDMELQTIECCTALSSAITETDRSKENFKLEIGAGSGFLAGVGIEALIPVVFGAETFNYMYAVFGGLGGLLLGGYCTLVSIKETRRIAGLKNGFIRRWLGMYDTDVEPGDLALIRLEHKDIDFLHAGTYGVEVTYVGEEKVKGNVLYTENGSVSVYPGFNANKASVLCALEEYERIHTFTSADIGRMVALHANLEHCIQESVYHTGKVVGVGKDKVYICPYAECSESERKEFIIGENSFVFKGLRPKIKEPVEEECVNNGPYR